MSIHFISVNKKALNNIKTRKKTIEGRLKKGYIVNMQIKKNDKILFHNQDNNRYLISVKEIIEYDNLYEYLKNEDIKQILPHLIHINHINHNKYIDIAYNHYKKYYSDENLMNYKFLAIKF